MSLSVVQLTAEVSASGADAAMSALLAVGDAATSAGEDLTDLEGVDIGGLAAQIDEISVSLEDLAPSAEEASTAIGDMAASSDDLDILEQILEAIQGQTGALIDGFDALSDSMQEVAGQVEGVAAALDGLDASLADMGAAEDAAAGETEGLGAGLEGLQSAMGPLVMIGAMAAMAGAKFIGMGMDGQKGEALLKGMAGASQSDIQALQQDAMSLGETMDQASQGYYEVASAGYSGAAGISVFDAATRLAIGGQASEQDTLTALTAVMHDYHTSAKQATSVTDQMAETIVLGKQSMSDYASSIGPLAAQAANLGISFQTVNAAEAAMTQVNPHVRQDAVQLTSLFKTLSPTMGTVAGTAKKLGLNFDEAHYKTLDLLGQLQYLAQVAGGENTQAFIKLTGGAQGSAAAIDLMSGKGKAFTANMKALGHSTGATQHAFESYETTIPGALDHVGASLSVFATKLLDAVGPKVTPIIEKLGDAIAKMADFFMTHINEVMPVLAGLAAMLGVTLVAALALFLLPLLPFVPIILGVGLAVTGAIEIFQHFQQILASPVGDVIIGILAGITAGVLAFVATAIPPLIAGFIVWATTAGIAAVATLAAAWPFLLIGAVVAAVVAGIILAIQHWGQIVDFLKNVWGAFTSWFMGILHAIGDFFSKQWQIMELGVKLAWNAITGAVRAALTFLVNLFLAPFHAIGALFEWLYEHNTYFQKLVDAIRAIITAGLAWLKNAWQTVVNWLTGLWNGLKGLVTAAWNAVKDAVTAGVNAIVNWLKSAWNAELKGLGDIWNGLKGLMSSAWNAVSGVISGAWNTYIVTPLQNVWNSIVNFASGWPADALQWGENLIKQFIQGITNMAGKVGDAVKGIASKIGSFLGFHSPTEDGPGKDADKWAPAFVNMFTQGLAAGLPQIEQMVDKLAQPLALNLSPSSHLASAFASSGAAGALASRVSGSSQQAITVQMPDIYLDGQKVSRPLMPHIVNQIRARTGANF